MWPNSQFPADLVTFAEEIINGKLYFLCSEYWSFDSLGDVINPKLGQKCTKCTRRYFKVNYSFIETISQNFEILTQHDDDIKTKLTQKRAQTWPNLELITLHWGSKGWGSIRIWKCSKTNLRNELHSSNIVWFLILIFLLLHQ